MSADTLLFFTPPPQAAQLLDGARALDTTFPRFLFTGHLHLRLRNSYFAMGRISRVRSFPHHDITPMRADMKRIAPTGAEMPPPRMKYAISSRCHRPFVAAPASRQARLRHFLLFSAEVRIGPPPSRHRMPPHFIAQLANGVAAIALRYGR